jgi:hypothetical protein
MLNRDETNELVDEVIERFVNNRQTFTPYDVTSDLRANGHQVEHLHVRRHVRNQMFAHIGGGLDYDFENREYGSGLEVSQAITFFPVATTAAPSDTVDDSTLDDYIWSL